MTFARVYEAAGATRGFFYTTGPLELDLDRSTSERLVLTGGIREGRLEGRFLRSDWLGAFDPVSGDGAVREIRELVGGERHFLLRFDAPIPFDELFGDVEALARDGIEIRGNGFANVLEGDAGPDLIRGAGGDDRLLGRAGDDRILGGGGDDAIFGARGDDLLFGGGGDDRLVDRSGRCVLDGGSGADRLVAATTFAELTGGRGRDAFVFFLAEAPASNRRQDSAILDFAPGRDVIDLSNIEADAPLAFIGDDPFGGAAGEARYVRGRLRADLDGDGAADLVIALAAAPPLEAGDLIL